jgi:hypothetical protein
VGNAALPWASHGVELTEMNAWTSKRLTCHDKNDKKQTTPVPVACVVVEIHGGKGKVGKGGEAQLIARLENAVRLTIESSEVSCPAGQP